MQRIKTWLVRTLFFKQGNPPPREVVANDPYAGLRILLDTLGMDAVEAAVQNGMSRELAGQRVATFNDFLIEELKRRKNV